MVISEFMADNEGFLRDEDGDSPDWIELYNAGPDPVRLEGWFLTDDASRLTQWRLPATNLASHACLVIFASGKDRAVAGRELHTNFKLAAAGEFLGLTDPGTNLVFAFTAAYPPQVANVSYGIPSPSSLPPLHLVKTGSLARILVPGNALLGTNWIAPEFDDSTWLSGANGVGYDRNPDDPLSYLALIKTDVTQRMYSSNATCYVRIPFAVDAPAEFSGWTLEMQYDDGFVAWLNGEEVVRRNAPDSLGWNSSAVMDRPHTNAITPENFNFSAFAEFIRPGTNLLAIQGLNYGNHSDDFLVLAGVVARSATNVTGSPRYFTTPTPSEANLGGVEVLGPVIQNVTRVPTVPEEMQPVRVTARVMAAFSPVATVSLHFRVMFSNEIVIPMLDDGNHGDGLAGDGVYGAAIPAGAGSPGEMLRYYVSALDSENRPSRFPLFLEADGSPQYEGTVIRNPNLISNLPVLQWFVADTNAANTLSGTRASLYYAGELYDNVFMRIRGRYALNFPKKSYKFDFNDGDQFRLIPDHERVAEINLNTTYGDQSYLRTMLGYETFRDAACPACLAFNVRTWQNNRPFSVAVLVEQMDRAYLRRNGFDPNGALYKAQDGSRPNSALDFEKKTRRSEDTSDLEALLDGLMAAGTNRTVYLFDHVNLPEVINYMAACVIFQMVDRTVQNYYYYRDTEGNGEWSMLPWDVDLSFGQLNYTDNSLTGHSDSPPPRMSHPFHGARNWPYWDQWVQMLDAIIMTPETREMFLRRLRTLMDQQLQPPDTLLSSLRYEHRLDQLVSLLGAEVDADKQCWGSSLGAAQPMRVAVDALKSNFLNQHRSHLFQTHCATNTGYADRAGIPGLQPACSPIQFGALEVTPASGNQAEEFVQLVNTNRYAVDISGWQITGGIRFSFAPGTVLCANSVVYVSPDVNAFRARSATPHHGQGVFVQGNYTGQLSARGESLSLATDQGLHICTTNFAAHPSPAQQYLRVTEIMYHPAPLTGSAHGAEDFEYIELKNFGPAALSLTGVRFTDGINFDFTDSGVTSLASGATVLVVANLAAFNERYGGTVPPSAIAGVYLNSLENRGERLRLVDASGEEILDFSYDDAWYPMTDGLGFPLVVVDGQAEPDSWNQKNQWRTGSQLGGSPGQNEAPSPAFPPVVVHEALTRTETPPPTDSIELHNPGTNAANIGGWYLSDDFHTPRKYRIPDGTSIAPGGYSVFDESQFNPGGNGFALGADGDEVWLFSADAAGNPTGYFHGFGFGAADDGVSFGRVVTTDGKEHFVVQAVRTLGTENSFPRIGPVVITEIMYHPAEVQTFDEMFVPRYKDNVADEYIEVRNISLTPVPLYDPAAPTNAWRLSGGIDYVFPPNVTMAPGEYMLLVNFDPASIPALDPFRAKYGLDPGLRLFGPYQGKLSNDSDDVKLEKPGVPGVSGTPYVLVDEVEYADTASWPVAAEGAGASLQRMDLLSYGNDPVNWTSTIPTPGRNRATTGDAPLILSQPANQSVLAFTSLGFAVTVNGMPPLHCQWRLDGVNIPGATNATLQISSAQFTDAGSYSAVVFNAAGWAQTTNFTLAVLVPAAILLQPQSLKANPGANVTFMVQAVSATPIMYQWLCNGIEIPHATNATLLLANVQPEQAGVYTVALTDGNGTVLSVPATLTILSPPLIIEQPQNQVALEGGTATFTVVVGGAPPFGYRWRRNGVSFVPFGLGGPSLTLTNVLASDSGARFEVVITNAANLSGVYSQSAYLTVLADSDHDGMADLWEIQHGFSPNDPSDAAGDSDGDIMSNLQEFVAGTDPRDSESYLKVQSLTGNRTALLCFFAISNKTYTVQYSETLPVRQWFSLTNVNSRPTNRVLNILDPNPGMSRFYRLVTPRAP